MRRLFLLCVVIAGLTAGLGAGAARAQLPEPEMTQEAPNPLTDATVKPGKMLLFDLEARFAKDVLERVLPTGSPTMAWRWAMGRRR
jgi:hypothetical protein